MARTETITRTLINRTTRCLVTLGRLLKMLFSNCTVILFAVMISVSLVLLSYRPQQYMVNIVYIDLERMTPYVTNKMFLSIALDSSLIADRFFGFKMDSLKLIKKLTHLSPAYLRIGGTMADRLLFVPEAMFPLESSYSVEDGDACAYESKECGDKPLKSFYMSGSEWLHLNEMAKAANLTLLFDLNCLIRYSNGSWNSENAEELISFSDKYSLDVHWELGNEPNAFKHVFGEVVTAEQLAVDFIKLRRILNKYPRYTGSLLVGPDTTRPQPNHKESVVYLQRFLENCDTAIDAVTWHQYYFNGRIAAASDFINPCVFDELYEQIIAIKNVVRASSTRNLPIWLGETSSAYGGGAPGFSDRFISTFIWLDKLGMAAENGIDVVIRQSLYKGFYALLDYSLQPTPDWWVSVLYKTLVGPEVVPCNRLSSAKVRLYCHCTRKKDSSILSSSLSSYITVFGMNLQNVNSFVRIESVMPITQENINYYNINSYILTSTNMLSKNIFLNGEMLYLEPDGSLPPINPMSSTSVPHLVMPPFSLAFWVVRNQNPAICNS